MTVNLATTEELWDLDLPVIAPRSRLFHLEPIGVGTPYVESLTSYVARLAIAHSVPPGTLLAIEIGSLVKKNYLPNTKSIGAIIAQQSVKALNGNRFGALQLVQALEALTLRTDLRFLTMLLWAKVFPSLGLLKHHSCWCPSCYQQWREQGLVIYSPLLWTLLVVTVCPYHHRHLQSQCPHCQQEFVPLWRNTRPGYCLKCNGWLGNDSRDQQTLLENHHELQQEIWVANTLGNLISQAPEQQQELTRETIRIALSTYINKYTNGDIHKFAQLLGISPPNIIQWHRGTSIPKLEQLLKICYHLKITLLDFFQFKVAQEVLEIKPSPSLSPKQPKINRIVPFEHQLYNRERIRSLLQNVLNSNESPPPSVRKITRRYHVSLATCYRYATDLCQAISLRYKDYKKLQHKQAIEIGISEVRRLAPKLYAQGINPTVKHIRCFMTHPETLWYKEVVSALSEVRSSLKD